MRKKKSTSTVLFSIIVLSIISGCSNTLREDKIHAYGTEKWEPDTLGNHRIVLQVNNEFKAVKAEIFWRRRDLNPEKKMMILIDANTGDRIKNLIPVDITRESGRIIFEPTSGQGIYYLYYLPYQMTGRNYPRVNYPEPESTADQTWIKTNQLELEKAANEQWPEIPGAEIIEIQSIDSFNSFYPMEVIARQEEVQDFLSEYPDLPFVLFPESREFPIRMTDDLPYRWIEKGMVTQIQEEACLNEYFAFQIGLFAASGAIKDVNISFTDLSGKSDKALIPADKITCINKTGINWDGQAFTKEIPVDEGKIQALWFGIDIPDDISPGKYQGKITIQPDNLLGQSVAIELIIKKELLEDRGDSEPWRHSRLRWLNSQLAVDKECIEPFTSLVIEENAISCLGRKVILNEFGFPYRILTFFNPEVTHIEEEGKDVLNHPVELIIRGKGGKSIGWDSSDFKFLDTSPGLVSWVSVNSNENLQMECKGNMEFDGYVGFNIIVTAKRDIDLNDIQLQIPVKKEFAKYFMGLGQKGGKRKNNVTWKWDWQKNQEGAWIGNTNGGFQFGLRGKNYSRPLNTNFYLSKPLNMPDSWYNEGKGGIDIREQVGDLVLITAYSGPRKLKTNQELHFNFNLLLTPFKPLDTKLQWATRFYHRYNPVDTILATGATVVNVHHANEVNPYINYPFIHQDEMKKYITEAHEKNLKVKIYNTIRELSNHAPEVFAIRSLGHEIFSPGPGNGYSWLQEHVGEDYIAAWFVPHLKDAAIINSGMSRWHNYYIEGLEWLTKNMEIDGLYIDDVAFDRTTMKRVRKILDRNRQGALIDLHSANQYNVRDGFINSASLYMEHFPYINRLWFGEYFDKDSPSDFWLVEMSGIPFGLMGEMLQDGGNKYRGMVYGMTSRLPWAGDPRGIWKIWDEFGIEESEMMGYWSSECPVKTGRSDILATSYVRDDGCLVAIGSWASEMNNINLIIDWTKIGVAKENARIEAPFIKDFQEHKIFLPGDPIPVEPGKGWLLIISEESN